MCIASAASQTVNQGHCQSLAGARVEKTQFAGLVPPLLPNLHNELKQGLSRQPAAKDREGLKRGLRRYMRRLQREPARVRAFFQAPTTRYAA